MALLLRVAKRVLPEERASIQWGADVRAALDADDDREALRLANDHGVSELRLRAYDSLARSRGVGLEHVLRLALRGELRDVVLMPTRPRPAEGPDAAA